MVNWQDLEMDEIAEWPLVPQLVVLFMLVLLVQGFGYWFYLKPEQARLDNLIQEEQTLKVALRIKANKVAALPQLQSQLDELTTRYELLLQQLPAQKELATMLASVNELGIDNKLTFTRIDWGEKQSEHFLYRLPLNIELTGDFHDIGRFSQAIATLPRIITFKDVTWQRVSQESETLHFRVKANTYQFKPEEKKDAK
ncbi:type 4a pilus biogenesis protein PilO [Vibrio owensii]|uniref:type 4a pilus biogenesis protein PilO n=1 Tax=Vibrio owensii TaxID=696485 RepID=UPI0040687636